MGFTLDELLQEEQGDDTFITIAPTYVNLSADLHRALGDRVRLEFTDENANEFTLSSKGATTHVVNPSQKAHQLLAGGSFAKFLIAKGHKVGRIYGKRVDDKFIFSREA